MSEQEADKRAAGLELLRQPFPAHQISKLPKPTKAQTDAVRQDYKKGIRCQLCGAWHHPDVVHLDYVGHAALTDRLLDCDPSWSWEPCVDPGLPNPGRGMWIKLTVCGVSRLGYGHADGKEGGDAIKETIGDALRNAAMRFGAALDLWHKGDLHLDEAPEAPADTPAVISDADCALIIQLIEATATDARKFCEAFKIASVKALPVAAFPKAKAMLEKKLADAAMAADNSLADDAAFLGEGA
jgi:hypothetical protein